MTQPIIPPSLPSRQHSTTPPEWIDRVSSSLAGGESPISVAGDGSDGNVTISGTTTLTRDMFYNNLTIESSGILQPDGYAVHVRRLLLNQGIIRRDGTAGQSRSGQPPVRAGGAGGAALVDAHYGGSTAGAPGGNGGIWSSQFNGDNGSIGADVSSGKGGGGSTGGNGGNVTGGAGGTGGTGGAGGSVTAPVASESGFRIPPNTITLIDKNGNEVQGGAGGGGGGGGANDLGNHTGGGGGGGAGGGVLAIFATAINNLGTIRAQGGAGGVGGSGYIGAVGVHGGAGGGGGGGGGWVVLVYGTINNTGTIHADGGAGGLGGTGSVTGGGGTADNGTAGTAGSPGEVLQTQL